MIDRHIITSILETAVQAPSGENAQPWRFTVDGDHISLYDIPENDRSLYNFRQRASYISHGAVIENIAIAAAHAGMAATVAIASNGTDPDLVAVITLSFTQATEDNSLYGSIPGRSTNRKTYKSDPIPPSTINALVATSKDADGIAIKFVSDRAAIEHLAGVVSVNDRILLENHQIHDFFFSHVHWTLEEELKKRSGFYIEVLELLPPAKVLFHLFKYWPIMQIFNAIGAAKKGARENSKIYASAAAMGTIIISNETKESFIAAGRTLQRLWLTATSNGLSVQPLTGVLFFHQRIQAGEGQQFSAAHKEAIETAYGAIQTAFGIDHGTIAMMFRIGYAEPPTASSLKKPPAIRYI